MNAQSAMAQASERIAHVIKSKEPELYLSYLGLEVFPEEITTIGHLETLVLTGNQIKELPAEIHQLEKLRILDLTGNQLTQLPEELCHLPELRQLEVAANQLTTLPKALGNLGNLQTLDVFGNQITELPESIHFCHNLSSLRANENALTLLPERFGKLSSLLILDLSYNELRSLPLSFFSLTQLKELYLQGNELDIPFDVLSRFSNQPETLLERVRDYQKDLSEKLAKQEVKSQQTKIKALMEDQLAELIVIKASHYKSTLSGTAFTLHWPLPNDLSLIAKHLLNFDQRIHDIYSLWFCLSETMTSGRMQKLIRTLASPVKATLSNPSSFVADLRAIAVENDLEYAVKLKTIACNEQVNIEAIFPALEGCEKYFTLWLVITELYDNKELDLAEDKLAILEATLAHVISSYLHEPDHASPLANGILRLLLDE